MKQVYIIDGFKLPIKTKTRKTYDVLTKLQNTLQYTVKDKSYTIYILGFFWKDNNVTKN